ncbi:hypothetical protein [Mycoplasmopsis arginini]|uniref:hypothetical protein n=1 Tax=Mycoplasmopsis arginini TaxID=2094 RepID=UPI00249E1786|nr:hypothetical protein [Mycoplasmopsis arginini]MDI3348170.1 hypothetical protein [Mycoplasmopsis arginini]
MICTKLLSPIKNQDQYDIFPILDLGDFVIYKKVSNNFFYNAIDLKTYLKNDNQENNFYFEENTYFICSYKLFYKEFNKESILNKQINSLPNLNDFKLKQLKNLLEIIHNQGEKGTLIVFDYKDNLYLPFYVFSDPYVTEEELKYLLEQQDIKDDVNANIALYDNFISKLKLANETFLHKDSDIYYFIHTIIVMNLEKAIYDLDLN